MRLAVATLLAVAALAGCLQPAPLGGPSGGDAPVVYGVDGCRLVEAVVPGDMVATRAALPAGYEPVDYGAYWGGPPTGDSAVSVVVLDCARFAADAVRPDHAEALFGAYVELPVEHRDPDAGSFYVFDAASTDPVHRGLVGEVGWPATVAGRVVADVEPTGEARARAAGSGWWAEIDGTFPAGDTTTGTFAFVNHHVGDELVVQRLAFASFPYRTAPVELALQGVDPVVDLVGEGSVRGVGYRGTGVAFQATVAVDGTAR